jgi:hypothetical protein
MKFTCKDCPNRYPGCHDKCEKYQREKAEWEAEKKAGEPDKQYALYKMLSIQEGMAKDAKRKKSIRMCRRR